MNESPKTCIEAQQAKTESFALIVITICGLLLSGGVIAGIAYLFLTFMSLVISGPAFGQPVTVTAGIGISAGIEKERVSGALEQASQIHSKVAARQ